MAQGAVVDIVLHFYTACGVESNFIFVFQVQVLPLHLFKAKLKISGSSVDYKAECKKPQGCIATDVMLLYAYHGVRMCIARPKHISLITPS